MSRMLAHLQKVIAVTLLLLAIGWGSVFASIDRPLVGGAGVLFILLGYALFLAIEFLMLLAVQLDDLAPRPTATQLLRAWWGEVRSAPKVFLWRQPFRAESEADHLPLSSAGRYGVVFVHGFVCNRGFWNPLMSKLRAEDVPFSAINLEPLFGTMDNYASIIEAAVRNVEAATGRPVVLVGHSMGGVAIRAWLSKFEADARVRRVITIGSPHHGTWLARFGHTTNGMQMRQKSPWLAQLAAKESSARYARFSCFFGHCDNIVFPANSAVLPGARNLHIAATAHVHMAFSRQVFDELLLWLDCSAPST